MGSKIDKITGRLKEAVGMLTDNDGLEKAGQRDQAVGEVQEKAERAAADMQGKVERAAADMQEKLQQMVERCRMPDGYQTPPFHCVTR